MQNLKDLRHLQIINLYPICQAPGFYGQNPYMPSSNKIVLGEFWVDSDGEIFIDIDDPLKAMEDMYRFQKIQELQRKLQKKKDHQVPPINPLLHANRPRQAQCKGKGY